MYNIQYTRVPVLFLLLICYLKCINFNYKADLAHTMNMFILCDIFGYFKINGSTEARKTIWLALRMINDATLTLIR